MMLVSTPSQMAVQLAIGMIPNIVLRAQQFIHPKAPLTSQGAHHYLCCSQCEGKAPQPPNGRGPPALGLSGISLMSGSLMGGMAVDP